MLNLKAPLLLHLLLLLTTSITAQNLAAKRAGFSVKGHGGFILLNDREMAHLANQHVSGIEGEFSWQTDGSKVWHVLYDYPSTGLAAKYFFMDPEKPVGNPLSLILFIKKHLIRKKDHVVSLRAGAGIAYVEKRFSLYDNHSNNILSSRFSFALDLELDYAVRVFRNLWINTGLNWLHLSNGALKMPNQGLNVPGFHLGIKHKSIFSKPAEKASLPAFSREWNLFITGSGGVLERYPVTGPVYPAISVSIYEGWNINRKSTITGGVDYLYNSSLEYMLDSVDAEGVTGLSRLSVHIGHELRVGKVGFLTQFGFHFYDPVKYFSRHFQRYGLKYYINKDLYAQVALISHAGRAEFIEWGVGVKL